MGWSESDPATDVTRCHRRETPRDRHTQHMPARNSPCGDLHRDRNAILSPRWAPRRWRVEELKSRNLLPHVAGGKINRNFCEGTKKTTFYRADRTHTAPFPGTAGAVLLIRAIIHACQPSARARATAAGVPSVVTAQRPACTSACPQGRPNRRRSSRQR